MSVELRHLRALMALADTKSFTAAARVLSVSQPTLSRTIAQLEGVVGRVLVERTTRRTALTADGRAFADEARVAMERLQRAIDTLQAKGAAELRVGWAWAALGEATAPLLSQWQEQKGVPLRFVRSSDAFRDLEAGSLDAAIIRKALPAEIDYDRYTSAHLYSERLVAAVALNSPMAKRRSLRLSDLTEVPVALCSTEPTATLDLWLGGPAAPTAITVEGIDDWLNRIVLNEAVGVTSVATSYNYPHPEIAYVPIDDSPAVEVMLVWMNDRHQQPVVDDFATFTRRYFRERGNPEGEESRLPAVPGGSAT